MAKKILNHMRSQFSMAEILAEKNKRYGQTTSIFKNIKRAFV